MKITAKEAREITIKSELDYLYYKIAKAASLMEYFVLFQEKNYNMITAERILELEKNGFKVENTKIEDIDTFKISW